MQPERLTRSELEQGQFQRLRALLEQVAVQNPFYRQKFAAAGVEAQRLQSLAELSKLPLTTKAEFVADQSANPPYGTNLTFPVGSYSRMHQTSGTSTGKPLRWLDTPESWAGLLTCWRQIYRLMQLRPDDRLCFPFSFGPFLGFWAGFEGAAQLGNLCLAAGGMSSEARLALILENRVTILGCTPTYALRLAEVANARGIDLSNSSVRMILVAGEPGGSLNGVRQQIESTWKARVIDHWGMTEIGPLAVEAVETPGALTVLESECIVEILHRDSEVPVPRGEIGELVITNLMRIGSPVIRYRTGDLVREDLSACPTGRTLIRLAGGILGRADDMLIIRGNNVFPASVEALIREFPQVTEFRAIVGTHREMSRIRLEIEPAGSMQAAEIEPLLAEIQRAIKERLNFHAEISAVPPGSLPRFEMKAQRWIREV